MALSSNHCLTSFRREPHHEKVMNEKKDALASLERTCGKPILGSEVAAGEKKSL